MEYPSMRNGRASSSQRLATNVLAECQIEEYSHLLASQYMNMNLKAERKTFMKRMETGKKQKQNTTVGEEFHAYGMK